MLLESSTGMNHTIHSDNESSLHTVLDLLQIVIWATVWKAFLVFWNSETSPLRDKPFQTSFRLICQQVWVQLLPALSHVSHQLAHWQSFYASVMWWTLSSYWRDEQNIWYISIYNLYRSEEEPTPHNKQQTKYV